MSRIATRSSYEINNNLINIDLKNCQFSSVNCNGYLVKVWFLSIRRFQTHETRKLYEDYQHYQQGPETFPQIDVNLSKDLQHVVLKLCSWPKVYEGNVLPTEGSETLILFYLYNTSAGSLIEASWLANATRRGNRRRVRGGSIPYHISSYILLLILTSLYAM